MRKLLVPTLLAFVLIAGTSMSSASAEDLSTKPVTDGHYFTMNALNQPPVNVQMYAWVEPATIKPHYNTSPFDSRNGAAMNKLAGQNVQTVLPVCASASATMCLSSVEYAVDGKWSTATQLQSPGQPFYGYGGRTEYVHTGLYKANASTGMVAGSTPNIWDLPGADHSLGSNYWINAVTHGTLGANGKVKIDGVDFDAWGTKVRPANAQSDCPSYFVGTNETTGVGYCNEIVSMPKNVAFRISVKLGARLQELKGWFDGRMANPEIDFGSTSPGVITVEGSPIVVPTMVSKPTPTTTCPNSVSGGVGCWGSFNVRKDGMIGYQMNSKIIADRSIADNTYFRLSSWVDANSKSNACFTAKGVIGVMLTNATTYNPDAPAWDAKSQSLSFDVASSHSDVNGVENRGFYNLMVSEKVAKCLWGKNISRASASVSVTSSNGQTQAATTSFRVKTGWARFEAANYHYSAPKIIAKLKGAK